MDEKAKADLNQFMAEFDEANKEILKEPQINEFDKTPIAEKVSVSLQSQSSHQPDETIDVKVESLSGGHIKVSVHISNSTRSHFEVVDDVIAGFEETYTRACGFMFRFTQSMNP